MTDKYQKFVAIMVFYAFITYILLPSIYYFYIDKTLKGAGTGFVLGSIVSVVLWYSVGSKMV